MTKYNNKKVTTNDGITHDSKKEAIRWMELQIMQNVGLISNLKRQVKYILIPAQYENFYDEKTGKVKKGKCLERECCYKADFVYLDCNGDFVVEDTKGFKTKDYVIKRKLMLYVHGLRIKEV